MSRREVLRAFEEQHEWMNERVRSGIEHYRKGDMTLKFVNARFEPVENVHVEIEQVDHDFNFGANLFMLDEFDTPEMNAHYRKQFAHLFNAATLPFYWSDLEPEQGKPRFTPDSPKVYRRPAPDLCLAYCEANRIRPKAHCLNYDQWTPLWVPQEVRAVKRLLDKRMRELAERYRDRIYGWEVTNELLCGHYARLHENRTSSPFFLEPDIQEWSFQTARRYFPNNELIVNEAAGIWNFQYNRSPYYMEIERSMRNGAPIDAIGFQFHMFTRKENEPQAVEYRYNPQYVCQVLDQYSDFRKPMQITEVTIPAYSTDPEDEAIQAELAKNLYSLWFSCPDMESIIYWNTIDGYAAFAPKGDMTAGENYYHGALMRYDGSLKPIYHTLDELIHKTWHTHADCSCVNGETTVRAFYGTYDLKITVNGRMTTQTVHFAKDGEGVIRVMLNLD